jgi:hypothetical protein
MRVELCVDEAEYVQHGVCMELSVHRAECGQS